MTSNTYTLSSYTDIPRVQGTAELKVLLQTHKYEHGDRYGAEGEEGFDEIRNGFSFFILDEHQDRLIEKEERHDRRGKDEERDHSHTVEERIRRIVADRRDVLHKLDQCADIRGRSPRIEIRV